MRIGSLKKNPMNSDGKPGHAPQNVFEGIILANWGKEGELGPDGNRTKGYDLMEHLAKSGSAGIPNTHSPWAGLQ